MKSRPKQAPSIESCTCEFPAKETTSTVCCNYEVRPPLKTMSNVWCSCGLTPKETMFHCMMWLRIPNQRNMPHCILELRRSNQRKSTLCCSCEPPTEGNPVPLHVASVDCQRKENMFHGMLGLWIPNQRKSISIIWRSCKFPIKEHHVPLCVGDANSQPKNHVPLYVGAVNPSGNNKIPLYAVWTNSQPKKMMFQCML